MTEHTLREALGADRRRARGREGTTMKQPPPITDADLTPNQQFYYREYGDDAIRKTSRAVGRVQDRVECPFCGAQTHAYRWSRAGRGKRCSGCPAVLAWTGASIRRKTDA